MKTRFRLLQIAALAGCAVLAGGCLSFSPPPPLPPDIGAGAVGPRIRYSIALAPLGSAFEVRDIAAGPVRPSPAPGDAEGAAADEGRLRCRPALSSSELGELGARLKVVLDPLFASPVDLIAAPPGPPLAGRDASSPVFVEAESRGAQLLMRVEVIDNTLAYKGPIALLRFVELCMLFTAPPFDWLVPSELFELRRRVRVSVHDVRDPDEALFTAEVAGTADHAFSEVQHGIVLFNPVRGLWDDGAGRFDAENWASVYGGLAPHADRALQLNLLSELSTGLPPLLSSPTIRRRLEVGDPARARLHSLVVGVNHGSAQRAEADARSIDALLRERAGVRPAHAHALLGDGAGREEVLTAVRGLRTKSVDRLLFYFAGQGVQSDRGQALVLGRGELLFLDELREALPQAAVAKALFVLDASFGDTGRGLDKGSRTAAGSLPSLEGAARGRYLRPLADADRGWQVVCAAGDDETAGEYQDHGLLTGLLLRTIEREGRAADIGAVFERIADRYGERSAALLGGTHHVVRRPEETALDFKLELSPPRAAGGGPPPRSEDR